MLEGRIVLSTFHVNTLLDTTAVSLKTGKDGSGHVSLRSALQAANARPNADTIILPAGTITLSITGTGENNAAKGDLDIKRNVTLNGAGEGTTIIDAHGHDRVFEVFSATVSINHLTIADGLVTGNGGGLLNEGGKVTVEGVAFQDDIAVGADGANGPAGSGGTATGVIGGAGGDGVDGKGGGVMNASGSVVIKDSSFVLNVALGGKGGDGGIGALGAGLPGGSGANGKAGTGGAGGAGGNGGSGFGAGIYNEKGASLNLTNSLFFENEAVGGLGGAGGSGVNGRGGAGGDENDGVGAGGLGSGGVGGRGGAGGTGAGGGIYNLGTMILTQPGSGYTHNEVIGGVGGAGGAGGDGVGGSGGNGISEDTGGTGGEGNGGAGGTGGRGGDGLGGAVFNGGSMSGSEVTVLTNTATAGAGGVGGTGGSGRPGAGGTGGSRQGDKGGIGGHAIGGNGGDGGLGGLAEGGGIHNAAGASFILTAVKKATKQPVSNFTTNVVRGGTGGTGGIAGSAFAGAGGGGGTTGAGGAGGLATGGTGGAGGDGNSGQGGGMFNAGSASITLVTVNFEGNEASGGDGGAGNNSRESTGGRGGAGTTGGTGGTSQAGNGGNGGRSGFGFGGGIAVSVGGTLKMNPRVAPGKHPTSQAHATDLITGNQAFAGAPGAVGRAGSVASGSGGSPNGLLGFVIPGNDGSVDSLQLGEGGGIATFGNTTFDNVKISNNTASTSNPDVLGVIKS